ncbi:MAG: hypothetical protein H8E44_36550 [Planctomycetes bacterium]|nr:hypothetical protein [Planctomycetota bacterium]
MRRLKVPLGVVLMLLLSPSLVWANGMWKIGAVVQSLLAAALGCAMVAGALWLPRSRWGLVCWPVLGGLIACAAVGITLDFRLGSMGQVSQASSAFLSALVGCFITACALWLPRTNWGVFCWPMSSGILLGTGVALLFVPKGNVSGIVAFSATATVVIGLVLGLITLLVRAAVRSLKTRECGEQ